MHACAAGRGHGDQRGSVVGGRFDGANELLAVDRTHAGAQELEVAHGKRRRHAADRGRADDKGLRLAELTLGLLELLVVGTSAVVKAEWIFRPDVSVELDE